MTEKNFPDGPGPCKTQKRQVFHRTQAAEMRHFLFIGHDRVILRKERSHAQRIGTGTPNGALTDALLDLDGKRNRHLHLQVRGKNPFPDFRRQEPLLQVHAEMPGKALRVLPVREHCAFHLRRMLPVQDRLIHGLQNPPLLKRLQEKRSPGGIHPQEERGRSEGELRIDEGGQMRNRGIPQRHALSEMQCVSLQPFPRHRIDGVNRITRPRQNAGQDTALS